MTTHRQLVQHIHAGFWDENGWTSYHYTFSTDLGFERWSRKHRRRGAVIQWRYCALNDERYKQNWVLCPTQVRLSRGQSMKQRRGQEATA